MKSSDMLMIVPTRGRPEAIPPLLDSWRTTTLGGAKLLIAVDDDDPRVDDYLRLAGGVGVHWRVGPRKRLAGTLNKVVAEYGSQFEAVGFMGDDHRPRTPGWDERFAGCLSGGTGVVYGNDLLVGRQFPTAVMMTADIPRTLGYFCPPGLVHLCLDLVWRDWGEGIGRITYLDDVIIEHLHPANGKASMDAGYTECNSTEQVSADTAAYFDYRDNVLPDDLLKLKELL